MDPRYLPKIGPALERDERFKRISALMNNSKSVSQSQPNQPVQQSSLQPKENTLDSNEEDMNPQQTEEMGNELRKLMGGLDTDQTAYNKFMKEQPDEALLQDHLSAIEAQKEFAKQQGGAKVRENEINMRNANMNWIRNGLQHLTPKQHEEINTTLKDENLNPGEGEDYRDRLEELLMNYQSAKEKE